MSFEEFRDKLQRHVEEVLQQQVALFVVDIDKDELWETYLDSFPPGTNEIYKTRRHHDCSCCKSFIRAFGNVVAITDNKPVSIWGFSGAGDTYQPVVDALDALITSKPICGVFVTREGAFGTDKNLVQLEDGAVHTWHHFRISLPDRFISRGPKEVNALMAEHRAAHDVFKRSLEELSPDAVDTVSDLIVEQSLYRGEEWQDALSKFSQLQREYRNLPASQKDTYCWAKSVVVGGAIARIRNNSIGVLLQDITSGMDILDAVKRYESIVAPENYKRPKPIFTKKMVSDAQETVERLGLVESLGRRHAKLSDITINNVIFADRDAKPHMAGASTIFEVLMSEAAVNPRQFQRLQGMDIEQFLGAVLPQASKLEVLLENRLQPNLVSLLAPTVADSPPLFKWGNGFSWAYNGNIADSSMKERVKAAGGDVTGILRFSIQWNANFDNQNDFDAHCIEPNGNHIYYPTAGRRHPSSGVLDVDIIHPSPRQVAVENITWSTLGKMQEGEYTFFVHNYSHRGGRSGFSAEIEYDGEIYGYEYNKELAQGEKVVVARIKFDKRTGIEFVESLPSSVSSREVWGLTTNQWQRVSLLLFSPNYWDGKGVGNKHYIFSLVGCVNPDRPNGFFNEYLREEFMEHKRVFAALGNKMRVEYEDNQLSGLGFSSTRRNSLIARVDDRTAVRIIF